MDLIYIILAHKNPNQLKRLIQRLKAPENKIFIHIDKQVYIQPFKETIKYDGQVFFLNDELRENGTWGDIGIVKAVINLLKIAIKSGDKSRYILLSGQDYPLKNNKEIKDFFLLNPEIDFITSYPLPHFALDEGGLPRIYKYKINKSQKRGHFLNLTSIYEKDFFTFSTLGKLNYLRKENRYSDILKIFKKRRFPNYLKPFSGSQWWALKEETIKYILEFLEHHPDYLKYHEDSLLPDEMFFHSIIKIPEYKIISKHSITYVNWEKPSGPLPVTFKNEDFNELKKASKDHLFARKFDIDIDEEILDSIDKYLLKDSYEKD